MDKITIIVLGLWTFNVHAETNPKYPVTTRTKPLTYKNNYKYPKNFTVNLDGSLLGRCFLLEAKSFPAITLGDIGEEYPHLFTYLEGSWNVDYKTGNEGALRELIMASADNSIDPIQLFKWSLELNHGKLFEAILTIHELLRNEARFYQDWAHYSSTNDQMQIFFNKFIDIRGDLEERGDPYNGDHRGSWYRIWGSMLHYLKMVAPAEPINEKACLAMQASSGRTLASIRGTLTANLAEWAKPLIMYGNDVDPRKAEVNQWGYDTMAGMIRSADVSLTNSETESISNQCKTRAYLVDQEPKIKAQADKVLKETRFPSRYD